MELLLLGISDVRIHVGGMRAFIPSSWAALSPVAEKANIAAASAEAAAAAAIAAAAAAAEASRSEAALRQDLDNRLDAIKAEEVR